ncbi:GroES-like protein [Irpex rosettiformis]|uniref:GroES-like protein n=1 Tax=Irpex rosettiformis TaxID=378272 RepID=A0ACB8U4M5_9APHY|nr:GroES-like protein [Irpex rosettiformis]
MSIPEIMKASVIQADHKTAVVEIPIPAIDEDEILVKVVAVALNPTDWKHIDNFGKPGAISGCDFSGYVAKVGGKVENVVVGDHVAGFTHGGVYTDRGAFAEYTRVSGDLVWKVSENTLTHEEASTFGCGLWTAVQALFHPTRLNLVAPPNKAKDEEWIFVYGGSTSVGLFAIQLLHRAGYKVVTVASPKNWDLLKSLGADAVFDYKDPEAVNKIKQLTNDSLHAALDTIAISESQVFTVKALGPGAGKVIVILPVQSAAETLRSDITMKFVLIYTALGREFHMYTPWPKSLEDKEQMVDFLRKFPHFVSSGQIKSNPIRPVEGGIDGIVAGLDVLRQGKNSGEKLVVRISP